jgi:hypothetical protein
LEVEDELFISEQRAMSLTENVPATHPFVDPAYESIHCRQMETKQGRAET